MLELIKKYKRLIIFVLIGFMNTAVDFLTFTAVNSLSSFPIELNHAIGYSAGIICSFILNRNLTFKGDTSAGLFTQILRFALVNALSVLISMLLIGWLSNIGMNDYLAKIPATCAAFSINYIGYKLFVFAIRNDNPR